MDLVLLAALPILLTEYGFRSRARIIEGFVAKRRLRRTLVRLAIWFLVLLAIGLRPLGFVLAGLGMVLGELGAVALRRQMRIDIEKGRPHGLPHTHLIPFVIGIVFFAVTLLIRRTTRAEFSLETMEIGSLAPLIVFSITALWGWATMVTVSVVDLVRPDQVREEPNRVGAGEVIGVLERLVAFVLVASGALTAVGFVIAAKAAARFPLFEDKAFAEYFLIGTMTSVGLALLLGLLLLARL
ncbi:MAG: hypothetical protein IH858_10750 [Chloroflexi bacterium]|nr:hypothetical protein [Chloroflexota bacterium]